MIGGFPNHCVAFFCHTSAGNPVDEVADLYLRMQARVHSVRDLRLAGDSSDGAAMRISFSLTFTSGGGRVPANIFSCYFSLLLQASAAPCASCKPELCITLA
eukprot:g76861.t1